MFSYLCTSSTATGEVPNVVPVDEGEEPKIKHSNSTGSLQYDLDTIKTATLNFSIDNKLGQGGFGPVYKVLNPTSPYNSYFIC